MPNISLIPLALSPIASHFFTADSPGLVQTKHVGPYISQTNLYWPYCTKVCAPDIHQTSFHVLEQSLLLQFCVEDQARFFFLGRGPHGLTLCYVLCTVTETFSIDNPCTNYEALVLLFYGIRLASIYEDGTCGSD